VLFNAGDDCDDHKNKKNTAQGSNDPTASCEGVFDGIPVQAVVSVPDRASFCVVAHKLGPGLVARGQTQLLDPDLLGVHYPLAEGGQVLLGARQQVHRGGGVLHC